MRFEMHHRERRELATAAREVSKHANELAIALEAENDIEVFISFFSLSMFGPALTQKLGEIMKEELEAQKLRKSLDET